MPRSDSREPAACPELMNRRMINKPCDGRRPLAVARKQQDAGQPPHRLRQRSLPYRLRERIRRRLLPSCSRRRGLLPVIERKSDASWLLSLSCEGPAVCNRESDRDSDYRSPSGINEQASWPMSQEAGQYEGSARCTENTQQISGVTNIDTGTVVLGEIKTSEISEALRIFGDLIGSVLWPFASCLPYYADPADVFRQGPITCGWPASCGGKTQAG
jgi:hypothetical protein